MKPLKGILETCLYVEDLDAARTFYVQHLGAQPFMEETGRHVFLRMGESLLFLFDARATALPTPPEAGIPVPIHGAHGPGHVAFKVAEEADLDEWKQRLITAGIGIERDILWPHGARSIYFRDPSGNSLELATEDLWQKQIRASSASE